MSLTAWLLLAVVPQGPAILAVSPNGSDRNPGTTTMPLATVSAAVEKARGLAPRAVTIRVWPGNYPVEQTIVVDFPNLTIEAESTRARLTGGHLVGAFRPLPADAPRSSGTPGVRRVALSAVSDLPEMKSSGFSRSRDVAPPELFCDGKRMTLASYPNGSGWLRTVAPLGEKEFGSPDERPTRWATTDGAWILGYLNFDWAEDYRAITKYERATKTVTLAEKPAYEIVEGRRFRFFNLPEELDAPGEYWIDRELRELRFLPPATPGRQELMLTTLEGPMFRIENTSGVTIRGLDLFGGRSSAVIVRGGSSNKVDRCWIHAFGTNGVQIEQSPNSGVSGCDIEQLGGTGILLTAGDRKALKAGGAYAENNWIREFGQWQRTYHPGVLIEGVGNRIEHNRINDAPHNAILLSGNDHIVANNEIFRVCLETGDAGAVYMGRDPTMRGHVIRGNWFYEMGPKVTSKGGFKEVMAVYLDDLFCGVTIEGNLFEGVGTGIMLGGGRDNIVRGNVFVLQQPAVHLDARGRGWAKDKVFTASEWDFDAKLKEVDAFGTLYTTRYPPLKSYLQDNTREPKGTVIANNASFGGQWLRLLDELKESDIVITGNRVEKAPLVRTEMLRAVTPAINLPSIGLKPGPRPNERNARL